VFRRTTRGCVVTVVVAW